MRLLVISPEKQARCIISFVLSSTVFCIIPPKTNCPPWTEGLRCLCLFWYLCLIPAYQAALLCALYLTRTKASCADIYSARCPVNESLYLLYIGLEGSVSTSVWMRNTYTESDTLAADLAFCHGLSTSSYNFWIFKCTVIHVIFTLSVCIITHSLSFVKCFFANFILCFTT